MDNTKEEMYLIGLALILLIWSKFAESNTYSPRSNDAFLYCVNVADKHGIRSAVDCGLYASWSDIYSHGFVYDGGRCHMCRCNNAHCDMSSEEVLLKGPHHVKGERHDAKQTIFLPLSLFSLGSSRHPKHPSIHL